MNNNPYFIFYYIKTQHVFVEIDSSTVAYDDCEKYTSKPHFRNYDTWKNDIDHQNMKSKASEGGTILMLYRKLVTSNTVDTVKKEVENLPGFQLWVSDGT